METPPLPPPGWHDDPNDPTTLRYWDGTKWTDNRAPKVTAPPTPAPTSARSDWPPLRLAAVGGGAAIIVGSLSPWATVNSVFGSISINGTDGDGTMTLVGGGIVILLVVLGKYLGALILSLLTGVILVIDLVDVNRNVADARGEEMFTASVGWGLWLATAGAIVAFGTSIQLKRRAVKPAAPAVVTAGPETGQV